MISSTANSLVKKIVTLHSKKGRHQERLFLAEGIRLVAEAQRAQAKLEQFFYTAQLLESAEGSRLVVDLQKKVEGYEVSQPVLAKMAETENPQGILAVVTLPSEPKLDWAAVELGIIIDGLQDPGNIGSIIRSGWAAGADCLIYTLTSADPYQGKVVRASMGGIFYQKIFTGLTPTSIIELAERHRIQIVAGDQRATTHCFEADLSRPTLILVGNEARGINPSWAKADLTRVAIPQPGGADSLNAAVAAGILVYEAIRQRRMKNTCKT